MSSTIVRDHKFDLTRNSEKAKKFFEDRISFIMQPTTLLERLSNSDFRIIDIRPEKEFRKNHIPGAVHINYSEIDETITTLSRDQINVIYCENEHCQCADKLALVLARHYYPVMILSGGIEEWTRRNFPIEKIKQDK